MSRVYRIAISETLSRIVHLEDGIQTKLELLPILPVERMAALLAAALIARGFEVEGNRARRITESGLEVAIDLQEGTVSVSLSEERAISAGAVGTGESAEAARSDAERKSDTVANRLTEAARQNLTERLEHALRDLKSELDGLGNQVTGEALEERARQLGDIEEIHREPNGSMTIKVRL